MKPYYCFDREYNEIDTTLDEFDRIDQAHFLYIEDFDETIKIFNKFGFSKDGLDDEQGGFVFDYDYGCWIQASNNENDKLYEIVFNIENKRDMKTKDEKMITTYKMECAAKVGESISKKPEIILYDLFVYVKDWDYKMQLNSQPITYDEVLEALSLLRKPCLFGDSIEEYRIVKHEE